MQHRSYGSAAVDYATGVASSAGGGASFDAKKWHDAMARLGWGVLTPVGVANVFVRLFFAHEAATF